MRLEHDIKVSLAALRVWVRTVVLHALLTFLMTFTVAGAADGPDKNDAEFQPFVVEGVIPHVERVELTVLDAFEKPIDGAVLYVEADRIEGAVNLPIDVPVTLEAKGYDSKGYLVSRGSQDILFNGIGNDIAGIEILTTKGIASGGLTVSSLRIAVTGTRPYGDETMRFTLQAFDANSQPVVIDPKLVQWDIPFPAAPGAYMPCKPSGAEPIPCIEMQVPLHVNPAVIACITDVICRAAMNNSQKPVGYRAISAGDQHTCALTIDRRILCWGSNLMGQLGTTTTERCTFSSRNGPLSNPCSSVPLEISCPAGSPCSYVALDAGLNHTCAIDINGAAWCWGANFSRQLGFNSCFSGSTTCSSVPTPTKVKLPTGRMEKYPELVQISAGATHNCAVSAWGNLVCWGNNNEAQAGGSIAPAAHFVGSVESYSQVSAGSHHSCAVTRNARLECWGFNGTGLILPRNFNTYIDAPTDVLAEHPSLSGDVDSVAVGDKITCAHSSAGGTTCWGVGIMGDTQIRAGSASDLELGFVASSPFNFSDELCLIDSQSAFCGPTYSTTDWIFPTRRVSDVTVGGSHYCAIDNRTAVCWGEGLNGQLGDGKKLKQELPTTVLGP